MTAFERRIEAIGASYYQPACPPVRTVRFDWRYENADDSTWIDLELTMRVSDCFELDAVEPRFIGATVGDVGVSKRLSDAEAHKVEAWFRRQYDECEWFQEMVAAATRDQIELEAA